LEHEGGGKKLSLSYGVFTTDGEYEKGNFQVIEKDLPDLVRKIADSDVALYLNISEKQIVIGSKINLKIQGGRSDSRIFLIRYSNGKTIQTIDLSDILKRFFPSTIEYLQGLNYQIIDVWGEEELSKKIKGLEDTPLPTIGNISQIVAGKLLTGSPVYVETKDLFKAICLVSDVATILKPFGSFEYTFVISRLSFVDTDLLVGPNKPLNTEFDLNLDSEKILAAAGLEQNFKQILKNSKSELILRKISQKEFKSKRDLARFITQESWRGLQGIEKMGWDKIASPLNLPISFSAKEAIDTVLKTGNLSFWNRYISSPNFDIQDLKTAINKEPYENFEKIIRLIYPSLSSVKDPLKTAIYDVFAEKITNLHAQADQMSGLLAEIKPEIKQVSTKGKFPPKETALERELSRGRYISLGILILIIAVVIGGISLFLGWWPLGGAPSGRLLENGVTLAVLNITHGTDLYKGISRISPDKYSNGNSTIIDNQTYYLNMSKLIDIEPENIQLLGTLRIYTPELTNKTGFIGHYNQTSKTWEEFIEVINQPDFTIPINSGGLYGVFS
jgi:hypothetical protein